LGLDACEINGYPACAVYVSVCRAWFAGIDISSSKGREAKVGTVGLGAGNGYIDSFVGAEGRASERLEDEKSFVYLVYFGQPVSVSGLHYQLDRVYDKKGDCSENGKNADDYEEFDEGESPTRIIKPHFKIHVFYFIR